MTPALAPLVDSHAHLDSGQYNQDLAETIQRAREQGVSHILTIGCDLDSSAQSIAIASQYPDIFAAVGVHPHDAGEIDDSALERLREMLSHPQVVALGEIGLDYFRNRSPREQQQNAFRRQIRLAKELAMPIIVHDREAHEDVLKILLEEDAAQVGGVLHCFSGDLAMAEKCLEQGFYLSFPGPVTYPKNQPTRDLVSQLPIERLLVETDCPYLSPQPVRGKRNEPAFVRYTAEQIATLKGLTIADVARITSRNCQQLFGFGTVDQSSKIAYPIRDSLYLNITNRCTNSCLFCAKFSHGWVKGHNLNIAEEPDFQTICKAIGDPGRYSEVVFCGYGEPLLRLELVKQLAAWLKRRQTVVRINTDGLANLVYGRSILPELEGLVDSLSVSLNAANPADYQRLCRSPYGESAHAAVIDFIRQARHRIPQVTATAVSYPGIDMAACERLASDLGVVFRAREYRDPDGS